MGHAEVDLFRAKSAKSGVVSDRSWDYLGTAVPKLGSSSGVPSEFNPSPIPHQFRKKVPPLHSNIWSNMWSQIYGLKCLVKYLVKYVVSNICMSAHSAKTKAQRKKRIEQIYGLKCLVKYVVKLFASLLSAKFLCRPR